MDFSIDFVEIWLLDGNKDGDKDQDEIGTTMMIITKGILS